MCHQLSWFVRNLQETSLIIMKCCKINKLKQNVMNYCDSSWIIMNPNLGTQVHKYKSKQVHNYTSTQVH